MFNPETINSRLYRISEYFQDPSLRSIITDGAAALDPESITNHKVHNGLEEGTWSYNLLRHVQVTKDVSCLDNYIAVIHELSKRTQWPKGWSVDSPNNDWAPIYVRLVDKLKQTIDKKPELATTEITHKIDQVYQVFKAGADERRAKHEKIDQDFAKLFGAAEFAKVRTQILQPVTGEVTAKHCGQRLLEITDPAKRARYIRLYFSALTSQPTVPLAKKLAEYFPKHVEKYSKDFAGEIDKNDAELIANLYETFTRHVNK